MNRIEIDLGIEQVIIAVQRKLDEGKSLDEKTLIDIRDYLTEYLAIKHNYVKGLVQNLPCPIGTKLYEIKKACEKTSGYMEFWRPDPVHDSDCEHFEDSFYETPSRCLFEGIEEQNEDFEPDYCDLNLNIFCQNCIDRLCLHPVLFDLSKTNQVYGTPQFNPQTKREDILFLTKEAAWEYVELIKREYYESNKNSEVK